MLVFALIGSMQKKIENIKSLKSLPPASTNACFDFEKVRNARE